MINVSLWADLHGETGEDLREPVICWSCERELVGGLCLNIDCQETAVVYVCTTPECGGVFPAGQPFDMLDALPICPDCGDVTIRRFQEPPS